MKPVLKRKKKQVRSAVPVLTRIERKTQFLIDVLEGRTIPEDWDVLRSLTSFRDWDVPSLGMIKIPNPNQFVTTDPIYGSHVVQIQCLINDIKAKYPVKKERNNKPLYVEVEEQRTRADLSEEEQDNLVTQWTQAQLQIEQLEKTIRFLRDESAHFQRLSSERAKEIVKLRADGSGKPFRVVP